MENRKRYTVIVILCFAVAANAQIDSAQFLREVTVVDSRIEALKIAQFTYKTDSVNRLISSTTNSAEWLQNSSAVHVRQYAPGSAASFSTRGATSAQSAVLWGGVSINSAATGVSDLSLLPISMYNPSLLLGGSASFFGSGAIGGVLNLTNSSIQKGWHANFSQQLASFKTFSSLLSASFKGEKWTSKSDFIFNKSQNSFSYSNQYVLPEKEEKREHAAFYQYHIKQLLGYRINDFQQIEAEVWFNNALRETPNSILVNKDAAAILTDNYLRSRIAWNYTKDNQKLQVSYAFLHEWQTFEDSTVIDINNETLNDTNITASHIGQVNYSLKLNNSLHWQNGAQFRFDKVSGSNRSGQQNNVSAQSGLFYVNKKVSSEAVLRAELWNNQLLPLSPFVGARFEFMKNVFASIYSGYNYRIPGLNDRYWVPGGNINLQPESGWTGEGAIFYKKESLQEKMLVRLAYYSSTLNNYIQWVPGAAGIWSPQNLKKVQLTGVDLNVNASRQNKFWYFNCDASASYINAKVLESSFKSDASVGKQIVYQPEYKATIGGTLGFKKWYFNAVYRYTGVVSTSYDGSSKNLKAFNLLDLSLSKSFKIRKIDVTAIVAAKNTTNQAFETIPYYPMPLSNYSLTLKISI